ncbi:T9SS type B sorting domain-containing protein [Taibaiella soli]|uniref:PKD domain-containing protein n=1 Tax=Taibaiella soli TaxID=1649169 RepID=A0A2W2AUD0_9BACT|nr:gliding motility-associated C-terminal domain-containing protein [Taibaiella soli]PZF71584.1 hypothetical protein DN068_16040 [Taibaiella soli]
MNKIIFILLLCVYTCSKANAQGEQNLWTFGNVGINFNTATPTTYPNNLFPGYEGSASICNAAGQMLFYTNGFWAWNRDHEIMPELTGGVGGYTSAISPTVGYPPLMPWSGTYATQPTAIAGMPNNPNKYYIFSLASGGQLYYSVVDMSLNGGKGGIVSGKKSIFMDAGLTEKLTVVKGCNNIWVMARAKATNQYRAYEINDTGIVNAPVISNVGGLPVGWYRYGVIKFSPDGLKMAAACNEAWNTKGGLELYDFNPQTGHLSNALVLDSSSTLGYYYGACFSPDNSKLYATTSSFSYLNTFYSGKVRQFNLTLSPPAAIIASNTVVFSSFVYSLDNLGDLKRAVNGKIYFGNGLSAMNYIDNPNSAGLGCNAVGNVLLFTGGSTYRGMPNDIAIITPPDSVKMNKTVTVCFKDTAVLTADTGKRYLWDNGSSSRQRIVTSAGVYVVRYINTDCKYQTDSIRVRFTHLPVISAAGYSCPDAKQGKAWINPQSGDTTSFQYTWKDGSGNALQQRWSKHGDTLKNIDTGAYSVQIITLSGCDTTLLVRILALPVPMASFTADGIACKGSPLTFGNTSTAPVWKWHFGDGNFSSQHSPSYSYGQVGNFTASLVVTNIEGCSDSATKEIEVKGLELNLTADKELANKGEIVRLQSAGSEPYTVTAWEPSFLFPDQVAISQTVAMDTSRTFIVTGVSAYGCKAKASVEVAVNPMVFMPNGFTPNGDGLNDRFRPVSTGYIFVRYFEIYNRYGQKVYTAVGKGALEGWDGTFNGQLQDLGTYYYHINIETKEGGTIALKGDVILMR